MNKYALREPAPSELESDPVYKPSHYNKGGAETIEVIRSSLTKQGFMEYCLGNVIKYLTRWQYKGGTEDISKAGVYMTWAQQALDVLKEEEVKNEN